ncbi:MAG: AAA family ATPase [Desulfobacterales bacterium]|nr:AAA family ATPase [Desulfobacterales bacterium]
MESIQDYRIIDKIHERPGATCYRGQKTADSEPCFIELVNAAHATPSEIARFKYAYEKVTKLDSSGVFQTHEVFEHNGYIAIVAEPFYGMPLYKRFTPGDMDTITFLKVAIDLSRTLGDIHSQGVTHLSITPETIFCDESGEVLKLHDFGAYGTISRIKEEIYDPWVIRHVLPYMAPEQTGRINQPVGYEADIYALGVVLYELLTGKPPFLSDDPIEIIHSHIARQPVAPAEKKPGVPAVLSDIVLKLIAKAVEDRYQSGYGVMVDFKKCAHQLEKNGKISGIELARQDGAVGFNKTGKLFGREAEINRLMMAFDRVAGGGNEVFLVSGRAGIGKSSLINEIQKPVVAKRAYFIVGKAEQYKRDIPYYPIIQAFKEFAHQVMCETDTQINALKNRILTAIGVNAGLLLHIIPELEPVIGKQPALTLLGPEESRRRFNFVFKEFVKKCASPENPLVIFVDDLQWADAASLEFLRMLAVEPGTSHLLIIGAYRDNAMDASHPLLSSIDKAEKDGAILNTLALSPLSAENVNQLVADLMRCDVESTKKLSGIINKKTNGNPFFIHQFLKTLYEEKALVPNPESGLQWDLEKVAEVQVTDNVVDLMATKISRLPDATQDTLRICACFGNQFNLSPVAACHNKSLEAVVADLAAAENEGLISFKKDIGIFSHDRIREAVYQMFSEEERQRTCYTIGRYLLENSRPEQLDDKIIDIVNHLNIGAKRITSAAEKRRIARLNDQAGKKAIAAGAFEAAYHYFQTGIEFLAATGQPGESRTFWETDDELALSLFNNCAEAAYLVADYDHMYQLTTQVIEHARTPHDQVKAQLVRIHALMAQNRLDAVIQSGLALLKTLGIAFPKNPTKAHVILDFLRTRAHLKRKKPEDFISLPLMDNPTIQAQVDVMATITSTAYWTAPNLLPLIIFRLVRIFSRHGNTGFSPYVYAGYGFILCTLGEIDTGYPYGQMALSLLDRLQIPRYKARTEMVVNTFIRHWKEHAINETEPLLKAYQSGLENGDLEFAGHTLMVRGYTRYLLATSLETLDIDLQKNIEILNQLGQVSNLNVARIYHQALLNLKGPHNAPGDLTGGVYDETAMLAVHEEANDRTALMHLYFNKLMLHVLFENPAEAYTQAGKVMTYIDGGAGSLLYPTAFFYDSLARLGYLDHTDSATKRRILSRLARNQKKMAQWAHHAPANFLHKYHLVQAELAAYKGRDGEAIDFYKKAIKGARENEYTQEAAIACECLAKFYHLRGFNDFSGSYLRQARNLYKYWGANAKVSQLEENYKAILEQQTEVPPDDKCAYEPEAISAEAEKKLDLAAMMKISQAISSEIQLEKLLKTLMRVVIQNSGAEKAFLILNRNGQYVVDAKTDANSENIRVLQSIPVEKSSELPAGIISYTRRTQAPLVLDDAQKAEYFAGDPYLIENSVHSVLCMPLIRQQRVIGLIYMENNLTPKAFTPERLEMITLLSTQTANCLENAIFFEGILAAEKRAQKQREEYQKLIEAMNDGLLITDPQLRISYVNKAICRISGYRADEIIGRSALDFVDEKNRKKVEEEANNWLRLERHVFEIDGIGKDAQPISAIVSPKPLYDEDGRLEGFLAIVTDITDLKKAEKEKEAAQEQLIQAQKMEAIGTLAGGVAHDFNNYLMTILGSIDLITLKGTLPENLSKHVSDIKNSAELSAALTRQLLAFSRRQMLETTDVDLNAVISDVEKMLKRLIGENIRLSTQLASDLKLVRADFGQMEQIIMNLAINARDAMPNGGRLYLKTANAFIDEAYCQRIRYAIPGEFVRLTVEDSGFGMDREMVDKIFDPFFSTKTSGQGTGLGLSVVYGVVKQHNGWVNVYSEPNQGTTFNIYIPVAKASADGKAAGTGKAGETAADQYQGNQERILLIEDQADVREVVTSMLKMNGYVVKEAETIAQATQLIESENAQFDLLFSDVILTDGNGIDFAESISQKYPGIKIVLTSGYTEERSRPDTIEKKDFHFLQKPYQYREMLKTIKKILQE